MRVAYSSPGVRLGSCQWLSLYIMLGGHGPSSWPSKGSCIPDALCTRDPRQSPITLSCNLTPSPRFARYFVENGTNYRHLFKVFGIRFDILVDGKVRVQCEGQPETHSLFL